MVPEYKTSISKNKTRNKVINELFRQAKKSIIVISDFTNLFK